MPTTAWSTMGQDILRPLGLITGSTTTNITTNQNIDSTNVTDRFPVDDYFNNRWFIQITSGNNAGKIRRVTDFQASNHRIVVTGAALSAESGSVNFDTVSLPSAKSFNIISASRLAFAILVSECP